MMFLYSVFHLQLGKQVEWWFCMHPMIEMGQILQMFGPTRLHRRVEGSPEE